MIQSNIGMETEVSASFEPASVEEHVEQELISLRRSGKRPIGFRGVVLAHGMSFRIGTPFWYELNVFQAATGGYVADVRHFTKADGEQDKFTVCVAESLEQVVDFFETYQPAHDVSADLNLDEEDLPVSELAFKALGLRLKVEEAKSQYEGLVSEIFAELDAGAAR